MQNMLVSTVLLFIQAGCFESLTGKFSGLFTPNAGQHFRDEQRRRRSQFDRGTRLAALEEYDIEAANHQIYTSQ
jgi:hypothetical protein